ncbi:hypothetical protein SEVIR_4G175300v4 [Setaria viridis]|uniref:Uncharacterized protein n=2 Tax=Setaria TaxID=4554 RepID=K3XZT3_SETIT|nr:uncharacterized protein LOC101784174 [Setaria italica]XP_034589636.1 uncharacterized protein LOC117851842 [Setaria viridis]RCV21441.1 hypothetical protein SETIT_4G139800v2 [Setaria italica]TKW21215.1 hypothetical protein SEVIR_4G175300v2 [Setaria viridis]
MGRGRGRGRKQLSNGRNHEDKGSSGEEVVVPARKRRGRPQKRVAAEKIIEAEVKKLEADDGDEDYVVGAGDGAKLKGSRTEHASAGVGSNKRNRVPKEEEDGSNLDMEENSSSTRSSNDESTRSNGFRQSGSRRKSTPRRAAEAGL